MFKRLLLTAAATATLGLVAVEAAFGVTVTGFTPAGGVTGDDYPNCAASIVNVNGTGFVNDGSASALSVRFNGTPATFVQVNADNSLTVAVPKGATTGPISVTTAAGTATSAASINVVPCPTAPSMAAAGTTARPAISVFRPAKAKAGASVVISGSALAGAKSVKIGGATASFKVASSSKIVATVPAKAKSGKISVTTAGGTATSTATFVKL